MKLPTLIVGSMLMASIPAAHAAAASGAAATSDAASERAAIAAERTRAATQFDAERRACASRFLVNQCIDAARRRRRDRDAALDARLNAIDLAAREQRAADERAKVAARQADHRPPEAAQAGASAPRQPRPMRPLLPRAATSAAVHHAGVSRLSAQAESDRLAAYASKEAGYRAREARAASQPAGATPLPLPR